MQFILGIAMLVGGIVALLAARPRNGTPRSFVGTGLEIPIVITLVIGYWHWPSAHGRRNS